MLVLLSVQKWALRWATMWVLAWVQKSVQLWVLMWAQKLVPMWVVRSVGWSALMLMPSYRRHTRHCPPTAHIG